MHHNWGKVKRSLTWLSFFNISIFSTFQYFNISVFTYFNSSIFWRYFKFSIFQYFFKSFFSKCRCFNILNISRFQYFQDWKCNTNSMFSTFTIEQHISISESSLLGGLNNWNIETRNGGWTKIKILNSSVYKERKSTRKNKKRKQISIIHPSIKNKTKGNENKNAFE